MPNLKNKSKQYLFKNKLTVGRKSNNLLLRESFNMLLAVFILILVNFLIPQKLELINSFNDNLNGILLNFKNIIVYLSEILLLSFIVASIILIIILIIGAFNRILKVLVRRSGRVKSREY